MRIDIFSDVICPWCFIGKRRLERALDKAGLAREADIEWLPFELNPDMPPDGMPRAQYRARKFGAAGAAQLDEQIRAVGAQEGIAFAFERMERTPNTSAAHQLIALAKDQNRVVDALFRAYFEEAKDIGDPAVLAEIAAQCGVQGWPQEGEKRARAVSALEDEVRGMGVSAVPTFIFDRKSGVSGAHPAETLAAAMREAALVKV